MTSSGASALKRRASGPHVQEGQRSSAPVDDGHQRSASMDEGERSGLHAPASQAGIRNAPEAPTTCLPLLDKPTSRPGVAARQAGRRRGAVIEGDSGHRCRAALGAAFAHRLAPCVPDYATRPIAEGFNWAECFAAVVDGAWYLVVFRSVRRATADVARLTQHDDLAHAEASAAPGFLFYFKGQTNERRECLSFCLWASRALARAAAHNPLHADAARIAGEMYESYVLERYTVSVQRGAAGVSARFDPHP